MLAYLARRLALSAALLVAVVLATFLLHHLLPGDPAAVVLGKQYDPKKAEEVREDLGLNDPLPVQFGRYLGDLSRGDLGRSHVSSRPVKEELRKVVPATIELGLLAMLLATVFGVGIGILTALRPRTWWDMGGLTLALAGTSLPIFWLGLLAIMAVGSGGLLPEALGVDGLPFRGRYSGDAFKLDVWYEQNKHVVTGFCLYDTLFLARKPAAFFDCLKHLALPAIVLSTVPTAVIARITRAAMGEVLIQDYIRTARAKGLAPRRVVLKHALRNAAIPIVTSIGTMLGYLLGGAVLTETVFTWPGMGRYTLDAILNLDVKPLQASVLVVASGFVVINLIVDLGYGVLDPRVRGATVGDE